MPNLGRNDIDLDQIFVLAYVAATKIVVKSRGVFCKICLKDVATAGAEGSGLCASCWFLKTGLTGSTRYDYTCVRGCYQHGYDQLAVFLPASSRGHSFSQSQDSLESTLDERP
jgi:hypothetical protein